MPRDVERFWRTTQQLKRFEYGPRAATLARVADAGYATLASPVFTGDPRAPTPPPGDADTSIATTAFVTAAVAAAPNQPITLSGDVTGSGTTGIVVELIDTGVTAGSYTNTNLTVDIDGRITTAANGITTWTEITGKPATFPPALPIAESDVTNLVADLAAKAPLAGPALTGNPTAPTPATADNGTSIATTAFVKAQGYAPLNAPAFTGGVSNVGIYYASGATASYQMEDRAAGPGNVSTWYRTGGTTRLSGGGTDLLTVDGNGMAAHVAAPATAWALDANSNAVTVANGGSAALAAGSGLILIANDSNGDTALYITGGGGSVFITCTLGSFIAATTTPAAGKASIAFSGGRYTVFNNTGASVVFRAMLMRTRVSV